MPKPKTGAAYIFDAPTGLGAQHVADPADQPRDMRSLDLQPGTEVTVTGYDDDRHLVLVGWTDTEGIERITSVEPDHFGEHFTGKA